MFVGFMFIFGLCWVNFYGFIRDYLLFDEYNDLNNGLVGYLNIYCKIEKKKKGLMFSSKLWC